MDTNIFDSMFLYFTITMIKCKLFKSLGKSGLFEMLTKDTRVGTYERLLRIHSCNLCSCVDLSPLNNSS